MSLLLALTDSATMQAGPSGRNMSQKSLDAISDACHAPRQWLVLKGSEIVFRGDPDADYAKILCVLQKVSATGSLRDLAIIGNGQRPEAH